MLTMEEFRKVTRLDEATVEAWRNAGWLLPREEGDEPSYRDIDVARAQLIRDLRQDLGINDEGMTVVLDLVDQLHGLRRALRDVVAALGAEPEATRVRIMAYIGKASDAR